MRESANVIRSRWGNRRIVLLGVGHTHAHLVRRWPRIAPADTQLICVSDRPTATYSGMLPAVLAGQAPRSAMEIDLVRFCRAAGASLVVDSPIAIDHDRQELVFEHRSPLAFDLLSIGIGSRPRLSSLTAEETALGVSIKPMQTFLDRLDEALAPLFARGKGTRPQIAIVGGGVAGIEVILALHRKLAQHRSPSSPLPQLTLVDAASSFAQELPRRAQRVLAQELERRGIRYQSNFRVARVLPHVLQSHDGHELPANLVIWSTGAAPHACFAAWNLPLDSQGFIQTTATLQIVGHPHYFAVGDSASIVGLTVPKAGVFAVRQGPILEHNLLASCAHGELISYRPQRDFLRLINLADDTALAVRSGFALRGRWAYRWKRHIDDSFMAMHAPARLGMQGGLHFMDDIVKSISMPSTASPATDTAKSLPPETQMRCRGCGSKLAAATLRDVLQRLELEPVQDRDDVAWIDAQQGRLGWSIDFFPAPVDDPELAGRIAARHAIGDLIAKGIQPDQALAIIQVPELGPVGQRRVLYESLAGAQRELARFGCRLRGGHTLAGSRLSLGFTLLGTDRRNQPLVKRGLVAGDSLLLTQPLGVGVVLAALDRALCPATTRETALQWMLRGLHPQAHEILSQQVHAATDVTGFGLAGHLIEMLGDAPFTVRLFAAYIPILSGVIDLLKQGISSSLTPSNQTLPIPIEFERSSISPENESQSPETPVASWSDDAADAWPLLFDPQTCGGLLLSAPADKVERLMRDFAQLGMSCWNIGKIEASPDHRPHLRWVTSHSLTSDR